jgi:hypothetical protein
MIDIDDLPSILQNIYNTLMIDADDVGLALDEIMMYVEQFEMDEDMLYSFIKEKVEEKKESDKGEKGKNMVESLRRSLKDVMI